MVPDRPIPVLVVDDHSAMIEIIRTLLRQLGFADVDDAQNGLEALNKLRTKRYELVISDWHMAPMTGYELLQKIRCDPALKQIPFIMVTGESESENVIAAKRAGVNGYIVKPFGTSSLKAKIKAVFASTKSPAQQHAASTTRPSPSNIASPAKLDSETTHPQFSGRFTGV